jgi:hypothetical protein
MVALFAFVFVVALSAAHAHGGGEDGADHHDRCGVCSTAALIGTSESFAAPQIVDVVHDASTAPPLDSHVLLAAPLPRDHAPRGPPVLA